MGSSGGMSSSEIYAMQKRAQEQATKEAEAKQAAKEAKWQKAADNATVTTEGGVAERTGALSKAQAKKKSGTLAGAGESTFSPKASKLGE